MLDIETECDEYDLARSMYHRMLRDGGGRYPEGPFPMIRKLETRRMASQPDYDDDDPDDPPKRRAR